MKEYIENNKQKFLDELFAFLRIPSISADSKFKDSVKEASIFVKNSLLEAGAEKVEIHETEGHPIVYGEKIMNHDFPTVLVYGHYDVQPPDPMSLWTSPPFSPEIREGRIYARGASDDKGQVYMHVKALEVLLQTNTLKCNIKFLIEGEEEIGSNNLEKFIYSHTEKLKADVVLISDTVIFSNECPTITVGLRGLSYLEVEVTGPQRDLHSGMYGGAVPNPINVLCDMIASLKDINNRITIPGFYDHVQELSEKERMELNQVPFDMEIYKRNLGITDVMGESGYNTLERVSIRPTLDVNGIWGGYIGEGAKTVLPSKASAKISMRLVPHQSSEEITSLFIEHFKAIAPHGVAVRVIPHHGGEPAVTPIDSPAFNAASRAFAEAWGKEPLPMREGGSIPIVNLFEKILKIKTLLMGFGLHEDAIHSPNESFHVINFLKGIETIVLFYKYFSMSYEKRSLKSL